MVSKLMLSAVAIVGLCAGLTATAQDSLTDQLDRARRRATQEQFHLRYKMTKGEAVRWKVTHLATTETRIQGNTQTSKSRTLSTKLWDVVDVDNDGNITFTHTIADLDMWQKVDGRPEIRYDSKKDKTPPPEYEMAAKTVGKPLATVTISPYGKIIDRKGEKGQLNLGLGEIAIPLPSQPVRVGHQWTAPNEILTRTEDGRLKRVKTRHHYELLKVQTGVATIAVKTQVLTPVNDPKIEAQLVQEMIKGTIKFDVDAGRILSRQVDWDETVVRFSGAASMMKYRARFTEEMEKTVTTASRR